MCRFFSTEVRYSNTHTHTSMRHYTDPLWWVWLMNVAHSLHCGLRDLFSRLQPSRMPISISCLGKSSEPKDSLFHWLNSTTTKHQRRARTSPPCVQSSTSSEGTARLETSSVQIWILITQHSHTTRRGEVIIWCTSPAFVMAAITFYRPGCCRCTVSVMMMIGPASLSRNRALCMMRRKDQVF